MVDHLTDMALASRVKLIAALIGKSKLGLDVVRERAQLVSTLCELIFVSLEISFDFVRRFRGFLKLLFCHIHTFISIEACTSSTRASEKC